MQNHGVAYGASAGALYQAIHISRLSNIKNSQGVSKTSQQRFVRLEKLTKQTKTAEQGFRLGVNSSSALSPTRLTQIGNCAGYNYTVAGYDFLEKMLSSSPLAHREQPYQGF